MKTYKKEGIKKLCEVHRGENNTRLLSQETIQEIDKLLNDPYSIITSYVKLVSILEKIKKN